MYSKAKGVSIFLKDKREKCAPVSVNDTTDCAPT